MDNVILIRGCLAKKIYMVDATSSRIEEPHCPSILRRSSRVRSLRNSHRQHLLERVHYCSNVQRDCGLFLPNVASIFLENNINRFLLRRIRLEGGRHGTLVCTSSAPDVYSVFEENEYELVNELVDGIEDIYFQREELLIQTVRSHLALVNGLVLSLRKSLIDLNEAESAVASKWQSLKAHCTASNASHNQQSALIGRAAVDIDHTLRNVQRTSDVFCNVIERTMMVAKGYLVTNSTSYMRSCAVTEDKGFVATVNQYLLRLNASLPKNTLLWTFKTENFFSTCSHVTYYHHLMLFLENVIFHWSSSCSTIQLSIVFEDSSDECVPDFAEYPAVQPVQSSRNHHPSQFSSIVIPHASVAPHSADPSFVTDKPISTQNIQQCWKVSDRSGYDYRLVGNIAMTLQFSDEYEAEEMAFPMEIISQILSLLNSSLSRLSRESAVQVTPVRSFFQPNQEESYIIRVPCVMYFTDVMYEAYEKSRRAKQQLKLHGEPSMHRSVAAVGHPLEFTDASSDDSFNPTGLRSLPQNSIKGKPNKMKTVALRTPRHSVSTEMPKSAQSAFTCSNTITPAPYSGLNSLFSSPHQHQHHSGYYGNWFRTWSSWYSRNTARQQELSTNRRVPSAASHNSLPINQTSSMSGSCSTETAVLSLVPACSPPTQPGIPTRNAQLWNGLWNHGKVQPI